MCSFIFNTTSMVHVSLRPRQLRAIIRFLLKKRYDKVMNLLKKRRLMLLLQRCLKRKFNLNIQMLQLQHNWCDHKRRCLGPIHKVFQSLMRTYATREQRRAVIERRLRRRAIIERRLRRRARRQVLVTPPSTSMYPTSSAAPPSSPTPGVAAPDEEQSMSGPRYTIHVEFAAINLNETESSDKSGGSSSDLER